MTCALKIHTAKIIINKEIIKHSGYCINGEHGHHNIKTTSIAFAHGSPWNKNIKESQYLAVQ